jgi:hypothetical protein
LIEQKKKQSRATLLSLSHSLSHSPSTTPTLHTRSYHISPQTKHRRTRRTLRGLLQVRRQRVKSRRRKRRSAVKSRPCGAV